MKMSAAWTLALAATLCAAGCASPPAPFCAEARPIYVAPGTPDLLAVADPELIAEILAHNDHGARRCGWNRKE